MKTLVVVITAVLLSGCYSSSNQSPNNKQSSASSDSKSTQTIEWTEAGLAFSLSTEWRLNVSDDNQRVFTGPNNSRFSIWITAHKPEDGSRSIEDETIDFFNAHQEAGEEDLRYLEVGGVKGVQYLRDEKGKDANQRQDQKHIVWNAQRMRNDTRQVITVTLSSPAKTFTADREMLYRLLQSIRFT